LQFACTGLYIPLGPALAVGALQNVFGDANALFRKTALQALGGWPEEMEYGVQDWELFTRAALQGLAVEVVAEALYWYRTTDGSLARTPALAHNNLQYHLRPYYESLGSLGEVLSYTQILHHRVQVLEEQQSRIQEQSLTANLVMASLHKQHCGHEGHSAVVKGHNFVKNAHFTDWKDQGTATAWCVHAIIFFFWRCAVV